MKKNKLNASNFNLKMIIKKTKKDFYSQINATINLQDSPYLVIDFILLVMPLISAFLQTKLVSDFNIEKLEFLLHLIKLFIE